MRGRVIAVDDEHGIAVVRGERDDIRVPASGLRPGDLVDGGAVVRPAGVAPYPPRGSEVARLPRARMRNLAARARALREVRAVFDDRDFTEVETPLLVPSPGLEIHLDAVRAGAGWLITSPEYQMKRLLAAGFERIYQVCRCFRDHERGAHHAGEFTMIEWYRAHAGLDAIVDDLEQLVARVCAAVGGRVSIDVTPPWPRATVRDAMQRWAGVRVAGDEPAADLVAEVRRAGIAVADDTAWDDAFFAAFVARVDPAIAALDRPLILHDWPAPLAALARRKHDDPTTALRFEAYAGGLELGNAFDELTDATEQRARFAEELLVRRARNRAEYPVDERLLAALAEGLPPSSGIAVGFDRVVMLATGATHIRDVQAFTADEL
jgi:lysyl-tRNA synthetase class 2